MICEIYYYSISIVLGVKSEGILFKYHQTPMLYQECSRIEHATFCCSPTNIHKRSQERAQHLGPEPGH